MEVRAETMQRLVDAFVAGPMGQLQNGGMQGRGRRQVDTPFEHDEVVHHRPWRWLGPIADRIPQLGQGDVGVGFLANVVEEGELRR